MRLSHTACETKDAKQKLRSHALSRSFSPHTAGNSSAENVSGISTSADFSVESAQAPRPLAGRPLSRRFGGDPTEWDTSSRFKQHHSQAPHLSFAAARSVKGGRRRPSQTAQLALQRSAASVSPGWSGRPLSAGSLRGPSRKYGT